MKNAEDTLLCLQMKDVNDYKKQWHNIAQDDLMLILSKSSHKPVVSISP